MTALKLIRGGIYWTQYGTKLRRLAVVLRDGFPWVLVRTFSTRNEKWADSFLIPHGLFISPAPPADYQTRRALSFADVALTKALLTPLPKKKTGRRPRKAKA